MSKITPNTTKMLPLLAMLFSMTKSCEFQFNPPEITYMGTHYEYVIDYTMGQD